MSYSNNEVVLSRFASDVQSKLFPDNSFFTGAQVDAGADIDQTAVQIPQDEDGTVETVVNPSSFPLTISAEEDKKLAYSIDLIASKPTLVTDLNQAVISYDKRAAKLKKHTNTLETLVADRILHAWAPTKAARITQTTGTTTRAAHAPGATGVRKRATDDDILTIMSLMNEDNVPMAGRRLIAPAYMYEDLLRLIKDQKNYQETKNLIVDQGAVGMIYGYSIFLRSSTVVYTEAGLPVKKTAPALPAVTDNQAIIFYHPDFVRYCKGSVKAYISEPKGEYLGSTMNFALRSGGTMSRLSETGVHALVEDNG